MSEGRIVNSLQRTAAELWQDYLFLSREMLKFLERKEHELFFELMSQREAVQQMLDELAKDNFKHTEQGQALFLELRGLNLSITQKVQLFLNHAKQKHSASKAYDGYGEAGGDAGSRLDRIIR